MKELNKIKLEDTVYETNLNRKFLLRKKYAAPDPKKIYSFIPGLIVKVYVKKGQQVKRKEKLLILEAMKMQNDIASPIDGKIINITVKEGQKVAKNELLIEFE